MKVKKIIALGLSCIMSTSLIIPFTATAEDIAIIQAEDCILNGCSVGTYGSDYSGEGYVEFIDEIDDSITAVFDIEAGLHTLKFRYCQGEYGTETLSLYVNSEFVQYIEFDYTGDWDVSWGDAYVQFTDLPEGELTVELCYAEGDGNVDIDYIECSDAGITDYDMFGKVGYSTWVFTTTDGLFDFKVNRDPHYCARIIEYNGNSSDIFIDNTVDGLRLTSTSLDFSGQNNIHSVTYGGPSLPELAIMGSFSDCSELESFTVLSELSDEWRQSYFDNDWAPEECETSVTASFENCISLKKVDLPACFPPYYPEHGSEIGAYTFKNCSSLPEITLDGYWEIKEGAFVGCTSLDKVVLTKETISIGEYAFGYVENEDGTFSRYDGITIYGVPGTLAETYAADNDIPFVSIEVKGDANCDGEVLINDVILVMNYALNDDSIELLSQGRENADVYQQGDGIGINDAASIQKYLTKQISSLPESTM